MPLAIRCALSLLVLAVVPWGDEAQAQFLESAPVVPLVSAPAVPKLGVAPAAASRCMVLGLPLRKGWHVGSIDGRPTLGITGATRWQFTSTDTWPGGFQKWALARVVVPGGPAPQTDVGLTFGTGVSPGSPLAVLEADGGAFVDTGVLQVGIRTGAGFNVLDSVVVDGLAIVAQGTSPGVVAFLPDGSPLHVASDAQLSIVENGPAFALVKVEGTLADPTGAGVIDFSCRMAFTWGSPDVEVSFTVRNANIARPQHTSLKSLELILQLAPGASSVARIALPAGETQVSMASTPGVFAYQAYSSAYTDDVTGSGTAWLPPIPKLSPTKFAQEGYVVGTSSSTIFSGDKTAWPLNEWLDLSGSAGGCTVTLAHMPWFWPAALEASATGQIDAGLFTPRNGVGYTWSWRQHESRTAVFSFHTGAAAAPVEVSRRADAPVVARVDLLLFYVLCSVFPYDMLSVPEQNLAYQLLGIDHSVDIGNLYLTVTRFLPSGATGGENNHDFIERLLAGEFLRTGGGGQYLTALDLALWKSESQILRSDNFEHADDPGAQNNSVPHTTNIAGDDEHRYRGGIVLAWHLTGDERYREALQDELEILPTLDIWPHERSMYQSLVALAEVADALHAGPTLSPILQQRLEYFCTPVLDVAAGANGFGWDGPPGLGPRGCYVSSDQNKSEKLPGENYITRGFITASMGPRALFRAAKALAPGDADASLARTRLVDLARYSRDELYPWFSNPVDRRLVYSYGVQQHWVNSWETSDFHPILLGMAEAWRQTGDASFLLKGLEQIQAYAAHGNLAWIDRRLEAQHFLRAVLQSAFFADLY